MDSSLPDNTGLTLSHLPIELLLMITFDLPNKDIKSLRLTSRFLGNILRLCLERVFLSANPLNIRVFRAIADHDTLRQGVNEIIWDDALLVETPSEEYLKLWEIRPPLTLRMFEKDPEGDWPVWFATLCQRNLRELCYRKDIDTDRPHHIARALQVVAAQGWPGAFWTYYQTLLKQQNTVLESDADMHPFIYGLKRFPALKIVTVTPAAHGCLFTPLYDTPMIRAFPYGFNYPIPRGWPTANNEAPLGNLPRWNSLTDPHPVTEFIVNVNQLDTGLSCRIFEEPDQEYRDLVSILKRPGFSRLDLALVIDEQADLGWPSFRNGKIRRALAKATDLEHISLRTNVREILGEDDVDEDIEHLIPLQTIFPVECWPKLKHFELSGFLVEKEDMVSFLAALPDTTLSVKLSFQEFLGGDDYWPELLTGIHELGWRDRDVGSRPKLVIAVDRGSSSPTGWGVWAEDEVHKFLYEDGPMPFRNQWVFHLGVGVERDTFEPEYERPYVENSVLERLGIITKYTDPDASI
ncbi:hypothetical protein BO78DRAFT_405010 [Aspergillus sclerotiicarbonarius CBS 121057]|uniref:F-box domain-containing protein n=1 Tax=Aspergillus sclerotiicarbonarius (strain CBS 121057 / IBT 28362) TaxID=1448318 RepID=A0A319F2C6_ASPSB|nr:hypothetical protein BO78DRAFT_405010 [Aspergillus sclerotiicarbonarius CBS 121057]